MIDVQFITNYFLEKLSLVGKKILITAGPTHEPIDPVRFIGNRSSGKMGVALAEICLERGAEVTLVLGPSSQVIPTGNINVIRVKTAAEMFEACQSHFTQDAVIMSAAVADYTPVDVAEQKIKKKNTEWSIPLKKTEDILKWMGENKTNQKLIGFALETNKELEHAQSKLERKNLDAIVLNSLNDKGAGFQTDTNKITIIDRSNKIATFELKSKKDVANDIVNKLEELLQ